MSYSRIEEKEGVNVKTIEDFKDYFSRIYGKIALDAINEYLAENVADKYHLHQDPDSFVGSDDYYDVDGEAELVDLVIEDDSADFLTIHACYYVVYDELYCNPRSLDESFPCYREENIHGYIVVDFTDSSLNGFQHLELVNDSIHAISEERAAKFRSEYAGKIILNRHLLPDLSTKEKMKLAAQTMLNRYYPEYTDGSKNIDPVVLTNSMGLKLIRVDYLPENIEGIIYFEDGSYTSSASDADEWNSWITENGIIPDKLATYEAKAGSIVIVDSASDRQNNTLAHECCHWFLHRKPYLLQILLGEEPPKISCRQATMAGSTTGSYFDLREWQASNLSPRILLGNSSVVDEIKKRICENIKNKRKAGIKIGILADEIRSAIEDFSQVSPLSRGGILVQLQKAYSGLDGILPCPEGHYIRPYMYDSSKLGRNETFDLSRENYDFLYKSSDDFRFLIDSGLFVFAENHVCRVTAESIEPTYMFPELTDEARMHMDKYCIKFRKAKNPKEPYRDNICGAFRFITKAINEKLRLFDAGDAMPGDEVWEAATKGMQEIYEVQSEMTEVLKHDLPILVEWSDKTLYRISADADLDKHTLPDLLKGKSKSMKLKTAIQLCIGMQLPYELCRSLLKAARLEFDGSPLHIAYAWIIRHLTFEPLQEANKFLADRELPLLGKAQ